MEEMTLVTPTCSVFLVDNGSYGSNPLKDGDELIRFCANSHNEAYQKCKKWTKEHPCEKLGKHYFIYRWITKGMGMFRDYHREYTEAD